MTRMKTGRNDPCPCGSGRKYKHCCMRAKVATPLSQKLMIAALAVMLVGGLVVAVYSLSDYEPSGRVWSEEHQHWH